MQLYHELLLKIIEKENINIIFPNLQVDIKESIEMTSYKALQKIKQILEDSTMTDFECIEEIVCLFEELGSGSGERHDF